MSHAEPVAHLMGGDVRVVGWCEADLAASVGAAVDPELAPCRMAPVCTSRSAVLGPVLDVDRDLAVKAGHGLLASLPGAADRRIDQRRARHARAGIGVLALDIDREPPEHPGTRDVDLAEGDVAPVLDQPTPTRGECV